MENETGQQDQFLKARQDEIDAMGLIIEAVAPLRPAGKRRVLNWLQNAMWPDPETDEVPF